MGTLQPGRGLLAGGRPGGEAPREAECPEGSVWAEAARNQILALDVRGPERMSDQIMGRRSLASGRAKFVYPTTLGFVP